MKNNHIATKPRIYDAGGDLTKNWMVQYQYRNPVTGKMERIRIIKGLSKVKQEVLELMSRQKIKQLREQRYARAQQILQEELTRLKEGRSPLVNDSRLYADDIRSARKPRTGKSIAELLRSAVTSHCVGLEKSTVKAYHSYTENFILWCNKAKLLNGPIARITEKHAEDFLNWLITAHGVSNKYRNEHLSLMRKLFKKLNKDYPRLISHNPFVNCEKKKHTRKKIPVYNTAMRERLKFHLPKFDPQLWLFVQFVYYTALRPQKELRQVRISWLDLASGLLTVPADIAKDDEDRVITLPHQLHLQLQEMMVENYPGDFFLFSIDGKPGTKMAHSSYFQRQWRKFRVKFRIPDSFTVYSFKHTGATQADNSGIDRRAIQQHLGHSSLQQTEEYLETHKNRVNETIRDKFPTF